MTPTRTPLVNAFFRGDAITGKMGEAVKRYIEWLEQGYNPVIERPVIAKKTETERKSRPW